MPDIFVAPPSWDAYASTVIDKSRLLISLGIWDDIDELQLNRWLHNFKTPEAKYISACILDAFTYRSKKMSHSMLRNILMDIVPDYCREIEVENFDSISAWVEKINDADNLVRFVPVNISDGKVKSSAVVAREFIEANDVAQRFVQQPENIQRAIDAGTKLIVFLDDFTGSGFQFIKFLKQQDIEQYKDHVSFIYVPMVAHDDAIKRIEKAYAYMKVRPVDLLKKENSFFFECKDGFFRGDKKNTVKSAKDFYASLFSESKLATKYLFGMSYQCLTYSFFFSTPNNNLKALYHEEEGVWRRLVFRGKS